MLVHDSKTAIKEEKNLCMYNLRAASREFGQEKVKDDKGIQGFFFFSEAKGCSLNIFHWLKEKNNYKY